MSAGTIRAALRARHPSPEWAIFFEVANGTGSRASRFCDAMAMGLWPSRGLAMHGFEIKVSRHDWQREIANPAKAEEHVAYCDHWWIVAPKGVVRDGELPPTWGHMEFNDGKLRTVAQAPKLQPKAWTRDFIAALLRRAGEQDASQHEAAVLKAMAAIRQQAEQDVQRRVREETAEIRRQLDTVKAIEASAGLELTGWRAGRDTGHAIRMVEAAGVMGAYRGLQDLQKEVQRSGERIAQAISAFEDATGVPLSPEMKVAAE